MNILLINSTDMKKEFNRRDFVRTAAIGSVGLGVSVYTSSLYGMGSQKQGKIGIIGLDTSHSTAFTKALNGPDAKPEFSSFARSPPPWKTSSSGSTT